MTCQTISFVAFCDIAKKLVVVSGIDVEGLSNV
jgi:hypothetical protein